MRNPSLLARVIDLEQRAAMARRGKPRIAVFDLDDTLLINDIGEAVLRILIARDELPDEYWAEYEALLRVDVPAAYRRAAEMLEGLPVARIADATRTAFFDYSLAVCTLLPLHLRPRPEPSMLELVRLLRRRGWIVAVISASNAISVRIAASNVFRLDEWHAYGIENVVAGGVCTRDLVLPVPIFDGKADVYRAVFGAHPPLLTAGNSLMDVPLLRLTDSVGCSFWVGDSAESFLELKRDNSFPQELCFIRRRTSISVLAHQHMHIGGTDHAAASVVV
ncbi:MAG: haloacid dehalogenase-like hydrolase [Ignavibacteriae bacterium]|nr:haloacid dehalogenase-like hydrolase [Ignavibacteriota bacterium]